jgi:glycogen debranching enzyme
LPNRVSPRFVRDLYDRLGDGEKVRATLSSPDFFLPEINAQWITALGLILKSLEVLAGQWKKSGEPGEPALESKVRDLLSKARKNFMSTFWNADNGFLYSIVYADRSVRDDMESETAVAAAALLGEDVLGQQQFQLISAKAKRSLLQCRRLVRFGDALLPFGIVANNSDHRIYYDDPDYHSDVIWPRSTPYLIRLLSEAGEHDAVEALLLNTLDHQMTEGAILYSHELLSKPCGNNPSPDPDLSRNPVPVKNPIQFWSQWCDPFLEMFEHRSIGQ